MANPCCIISLKTGAKSVALFQMVLGAFCIIISIIMLGTGVFLSSNNAFSREINRKNLENFSDELTFITEKYKDKGSQTSDSVTGFLAIILGIVYMVMGVMDVLLSLLLYIGANQGNVKKCEAWLTITVILLAISVVQFVSEAFNSRANVSDALRSFFCLLLNAYFVWVVKAFVDQLRSQKTASMENQISTA